MHKYLTFMSAGGAKKSKEYTPDKDELQMLIASCKSRGIDTKNLGNGADVIKKMTEKVLDNSNIKNIDHK